MDEPSSSISAIIDSIYTADSLNELLSQSSEQFGRLLSASRALILLQPNLKGEKRSLVEWTREAPNPEFDRSSISLAKYLQELSNSLEGTLSVSDVSSHTLFTNYQREREELEVNSLLVSKASFRDQNHASVIIYDSTGSRVWLKEEAEILEELSSHLAIAIHQFLLRGFPVEAKAVAAMPRNSKKDALYQHYERVVEHADAVIFHSDSAHFLRFMSSRGLDLLGVTTEDIVSEKNFRWFDVIHPNDRERVKSVALEFNKSPIGFDEEFRIVNQVTGKVRYLLAKLTPVFDKDQKVSGWDGFAVDITARHEALNALDQQSRKVKALYTVSSAIRGFLDPVNIASRGLVALCDATRAKAGLCYMLEDLENLSNLELLAHHGFSVSFVDNFSKDMSLYTIFNHSISDSRSIVVPDIEADRRIKTTTFEDEDLSSLVVVPISVDEEILGVVAIFGENLNQFSSSDVMLVSAAANQIGLAARQAKLFDAYRRQTRDLSSLYRLSHELSQNFSLDEMFQIAFKVIRDELGLKRIWVGLLNESGNRLIGQAAYGPGWKRKLVEISVDVKGSGNPIAKVVHTKQPLRIESPEEVLNQFGIRKLFARLSIDSVVLVPLVASGQVLGILAVQPEQQSKSFAADRISLLSSLANEIAAMVLTKRLEERIAEGEKMRTAGLLAAGIAHNFNNILQAIMGQASLLEMQSKGESPIIKAVGIINEAASRGAQLVKQLLSVANLEDVSREICNVNDVIERSLGSFHSLLKEKINFEVKLTDDLPNAYVDPRHLVRIINTLIGNSVEALAEGGEIQLFTDYIDVDRKSPYYEVPFGQYIRIGVRDDGVGMDAETKKRCFEPFFTTKNVDPTSGLGMSGAGLGLAAAYALAKKNGGRLVVDSRPEHGSLFTLYVRSADQLLMVDEDTKEATSPNKVLSLQNRIEREYIKRDVVALKASESKLEKKKI